MSKIRTRYAPSPTGYLHAGQIRSALFNYLFAKQKGGTFIVRIEDTDRERSKPEFERAIFEDLRWLGIEPDESPVHGGDFGPYRQSERAGIYKTYIQKLLQERKAFYCFHRGLEKEHESHILHRCEHKKLSPADQAKRAAKGPYVIRFDALKDVASLLQFEDAIRGKIVFDPASIEDFSIAKDPESPLYNFAVVVDDYEMKITHVIRGEDHISNTQKQLLLYEALGIKPPEVFAHLPLVLAPDRSKLSKRKGAKSINEYRSEGYLPEALLNFISLLGWSAGDDKEIFAKEDLIKEFSLDRVQKSGAIFDGAKLDWMNGEYIRRKSIAELTELCLPFLEKYIKEKRWSAEYAGKIIALEQPRLKKLSEITERVDYFFIAPQPDKGLLRWKNMSAEEIASSIDKSIEIISNFPASPADRQFLISKEGIEAAFLKEIGEGDKGALLWPLRAALSGKKASPGPFEIIEILGPDTAIERLEDAKKIVLQP